MTWTTSADVGEAEEVEGAVVGDDRFLAIQREPCCDDVLTRCRRELAEPVPAPANSGEASPLASMVSEQRMAEPTLPRLTGREVTALLRGKLEELVVIRILLRVMQT